MRISVDKRRIQFYLWVGLAYLLLGVMIDLSHESGSIAARVLNNIWRAVFIVVVNYAFFEITVPFVWQRRNILLRIVFFLFVLWVQLMLYSFGVYAWRHIGIQVHFYTALKTFDSTMAGVNYGFPFAFVSMFIFGIARHAYDHNKLKHMAQQLLIEKQQAELNYLKSQTNPHFLFNTLNNIYSLARDKSDLAAESVIRISKILRFMLYETGGQYISIEQEIKVINDYIELEKLRYDKSLHVNFNYDIEDMKQAVPPLLLIPLVENAFKHGASETRGQPFVDIHLVVNQRQLELVVTNSTGLPSQEGAVKESIGLSNLRRQLELLFKEHTLSVSQNHSVFAATLKINLASHA